ncbi:unnamed protein product [Prunus armeniaca]
MDPSLYEAARSGDVGFLRKIKDADVPDDLLHQKTPMDNNILHIAAEGQGRDHDGAMSERQRNED